MQDGVHRAVFRCVPGNFLRASNRCLIGIVPVGQVSRLKARGKRSSLKFDAHVAWEFFGFEIITDIGLEYDFISGDISVYELFYGQWYYTGHVRGEVTQDSGGPYCWAVQLEANDYSYIHTNNALSIRKLIHQDEISFESAGSFFGSETGIELYSSVNQRRAYLDNPDFGREEIESELTRQYIASSDKEKAVYREGKFYRTSRLLGVDL